MLESMKKRRGGRVLGDGVASRVERGSFYDLPSPQQTGHADFPHPAFHENYH
jgi:hypothetical protein